MPLKRIKRAFKKVTKPIAKVLDKVVPNEIKPFLPYAAAAFPFLAPGAFGAVSSTMPGFGIQNAFLNNPIIYQFYLFFLLPSIADVSRCTKRY